MARRGGEKRGGGGGGGSGGRREDEANERRISSRVRVAIFICGGAHTHTLPSPTAGSRAAAAMWGPPTTRVHGTHMTVGGEGCDGDSTGFRFWDKVLRPDGK